MLQEQIIPDVSIAERETILLHLLPECSTLGLGLYGGVAHIPRVTQGPGLLPSWETTVFIHGLLMLKGKTG